MSNKKDIEKMRIQKLLSQCGIMARRKAEDMIVAGKVTLNGKRAELGDKACKDDEIKIDGQKVSFNKNKKYYVLLNKPRGFLSTMSDERNRKCVADLVKDIDVRVYPVGRLDKDSEGALLMTNDGEFANGIMHPSRHIEKRYRVTVRPRINEEQLNKLSASINIDGKMTLPAKVEVLEHFKDRSVLEIVLKEGKNRQIRRLCEGAGLEVARLKRVSIDQVKLGMLKVGKWRELTSGEINSLFKV